MTRVGGKRPAFGDISMLPAPARSRGRLGGDYDDTEVGVPGCTVRFPGTGDRQLTATTARASAGNHTAVGGRRCFTCAPAHPRWRAALRRDTARSRTTTITGSATSGGFCGKKNLYTGRREVQPAVRARMAPGTATRSIGSHSMNSRLQRGMSGFRPLRCSGADRPVPM